MYPSRQLRVGEVALAPLYQNRIGDMCRSGGSNVRAVRVEAGNQVAQVTVPCRRLGLGVDLRNLLDLGGSKCIVVRFKAHLSFSAEGGPRALTRT